jgi:hypothetical protein
MRLHNVGECRVVSLWGWLSLVAWLGELISFYVGSYVLPRHRDCHTTSKYLTMCNYTSASSLSYCVIHKPIKIFPLLLW